MNRILIATNAFKGSLSAITAADTIEKAFKSINSAFIVEKQSIADGGDGFLEVMMTALGGEIIEEEVKNPFGECMKASYGIASDNTAVIEMARASGIALLKNRELVPLKATSYGTGQLIASAIKKGCENIIIGLGGSATVDAGTGMLQALGFKFFDADGKEIKKIGGHLNKIASIDNSTILKGLDQLKILVACDVNNPLTGETGAVKVFGPQKGVMTNELEQLESNFIQFGRLASQFTKIEMNCPYGGVAGGMAASLKVFLNARLVNGAELVFDKTDLRNKIQNTDLVITTEGKLDKQTLSGKGCWKVIELAKKYDKKVILLAGEIPESNFEDYQSIDAYFSIQNKPVSIDDAMKNTDKNLLNTTKQIARLLCLK